MTLKSLAKFHIVLLLLLEILQGFAWANDPVSPCRPTFIKPKYFTPSNYTEYPHPDFPKWRCFLNNKTGTVNDNRLQGHVSFQNCQRFCADPDSTYYTKVFNCNIGFDPNGNILQHRAEFKNIHYYCLDNPHDPANPLCWMKEIDPATKVTTKHFFNEECFRALPKNDLRRVMTGFDTWDAQCNGSNGSNGTNLTAPGNNVPTPDCGPNPNLSLTPDTPNTPPSLEAPRSSDNALARSRARERFLRPSYDKVKVKRGAPVTACSAIVLVCSLEVRLQSEQGSETAQNIEACISTWDMVKNMALGGPTPGDDLWAPAIDSVCTNAYYLWKYCRTNHWGEGEPPEPTYCYPPFRMPGSPPVEHEF
jgi:hypothetical protein